MMETLQFIFRSFWTFCGFSFLFYIALYFILNGFLRLYSRTLRSINIAMRGWPPHHLDADGDSIITKATDINPIHE